MRIYAIGDIKGQLDMLRAAHQRIAMDREACGDPAAGVIHLGDFRDRGPDSADVIRFLVDGVAAREPWRMLLGNHDLLFQGFVRDASVRDNVLHEDLTWMSCPLGGETTLKPYGLPDIDRHSQTEPGAAP